METILTDESPLAAYLEGKGEMPPEDDDDQAGASPSPSDDDRPRSFAPRPPGRSATRPISRLVPARIIKSRFLSRVRDAYAAAVSSTLGNEDNVGFLEHFRYIIIASQLLDEHVGPASSQSRPRGPTDLAQAPHPISFAGAAATALAAFVLVWVINWTRGGKAATFFWGRVALLIIITATVTFLLYAFSRRQWLKYLRTQAVEAATSFTAQAHSFETASASTITLIQEVELVSRGYRLSTPLPPVSRLEGKSTDRRCARLRKELSKAYKAAIEASIAAIVGLGQVVDHNDLERFLEVYDIRWQDLEEAKLGFVECDEEEQESIRTLRVHQFRLNVLRRLIMCSLLSIPATGRRSDIRNWRAAVTEMDRLGSLLSSISTRLNKDLNNEEAGTPLSPISSTSSARQTPQQAHIHSQVRRIATLTTSIRALQAKLYLLREDSTRALSSSTSESDVNTISSSLREQYEGLGEDLKTLMSAWEAGKTALQHDINRHSRRVSRSGSLSVNSSLCSGQPHHLSSPLTPMTPKGVGLGLASLIEDRRAQTLRRLSGEHDDASEMPLSPPATDDGYNCSNSDAESRDEVYEAVSLPTVSERSSLSREQRIAKMKEERLAKTQDRESRDAGLNMVRELKGVIRLRPQRAGPPAAATGGSTGVPPPSTTRRSDPLGALVEPSIARARISSL